MKVTLILQHPEAAIMIDQFPICAFILKSRFYIHWLTFWTSNTSGHVWLNICVPLPVENGLPHVTFTTVGQWMTHLAAV